MHWSTKEGTPVYILLKSKDPFTQNLQNPKVFSLDFPLLWICVQLSPEISMHFSDLLCHDGVDVLVGGQAEVELSSGHEVEGEPVGKRREQSRAQIVQS